MRKFTVTGMSCSACSARVEKTVSALKGIESCSVNLLTNSMTVTGDASDIDIKKAVEKAGYGIKSDNTEKKGTQSNNKESFKSRLIFSSLLLIVLMYISMGRNMLKLPLPFKLSGNPLALSLIQMFISGTIMMLNKKFFTSGFKAIINKSPNMDTLVSMGSMASFIYSVCIVFHMTDLYTKGNFNSASDLLCELYFESAAMILVLITIGKALESKSKDKTLDAINGLIKLAPKTAIILKNEKEVTVSADDILKEDIFIVKAGGIIPADGIIIDGSASVNESMLTGESIPVDKEVNDKVSQATVLESGYIKCRALKVGEDTLFSNIIKTVSDASATKAPIAKTADKISGFFVPLVILISIITFTVWFLISKEIGFSLARAISVLVISCPCALGLATPVAIMVGNGVSAKKGILFKNATALEYAGKIKTVVFDKTGTITYGQPVVTDIISSTNEDLLLYAYSLELKSEHPLAKAIIKKAGEMQIKHIETKDFKVLSGSGVEAKINDDIIRGGNCKFIEKFINLSDDTKKTVEALTNQGKTPLLFSKNDILLGIIAVSDRIKENAKSTIEELKKMGINTVILTGDNLNTANFVKKEIKADKVIAEVLPSEKANQIIELKKDGLTAMVGDGINDAPALTTADIGIGMDSGTDIAIDSSDIVFVSSNLSLLPKMITISKKTLKIIHENLFWAFIYNIIGIPLAAGVFIPITGWKLTPMFGAFAMSISSLIVVTNALRLNKLNNKKEKKKMEITLKIEGMMCMHCESRVKKILEAIDGVAEAIVSHENDSALIKMTKEIPFETFKEVIENEGYKVIG